MVIKMNDSTCMLWASLYLHVSVHVNFELTRPDGQVEVNL